MLIDSHAHLDLYDDAERDAVLRRAHAAGISTILAIGLGIDTMHRALDLAQRSSASPHPHLPRLFATAGIHPDEAASVDTPALDRLQALLTHPLVLACGEIGLDYYHLENPLPPVQVETLTSQLRLAAAARKPIILHCRTSELAAPAAKQKFGPADAWEDLLAVLTEHWRPAGLSGIMHCFSGTPDQARRAMELGFYLSFAGNLTYPAAKAIREAATLASPDRLLVETDAPFLAPVPHRGKRNEPAFVDLTARALADLRGISPEDLATLTTENFHTLFPAAGASPLRSN